MLGSTRKVDGHVVRAGYLDKVEPDAAAGLSALQVGDCLNQLAVVVNENREQRYHAEREQASALARHHADAGLGACGVSVVDVLDAEERLLR